MAYSVFSAVRLKSHKILQLKLTKVSSREKVQNRHLIFARHSEAYSLRGSAQAKLPFCFLFCFQFKPSAWDVVIVLLLWQNEKKWQKTGWAHVACEKYASSCISLFFHIPHQSARIQSLCCGRKHNGCSRWMFLTVGQISQHARNPSWELHSLKLWMLTYIQKENDVRPP